MTSPGTVQIPDLAACRAELEAKEQDLTATAEGRAEIEAELFDLRTAHDSLQQAREQADRDLAGLRQQLQDVQDALTAAEVCTHGILL